MACQKEPQSSVDDGLIRDYLAQHHIEATKHSSGMYYVIDNPGGAKKPTIYSNVEIYYKGYFINDTVFEETNGNPASASLQSFIAGVQYGVSMIGIGGKERLFIPSRLAYGASGTFGIPGNSVVIFDVELVNFW